MVTPLLRYCVERRQNIAVGHFTASTNLGIKMNKLTEQNFFSEGVLHMIMQLAWKSSILLTHNIFFP